MHTDHQRRDAEQTMLLAPNPVASLEHTDPSDQDVIELDLTAVQPASQTLEDLQPYDGLLDGSETAVPSPAVITAPLAAKAGVHFEMDCCESYYEPQPAKLTWYLIFSAFTASLGMLLFGYHNSELSASQFILTCSSIDLSSLPTPRNPSFNLPWCIPMSATLDFAIISSMLSAGGLLGSLGSSALTRFIGRKGVLAFAATIQVVSPVVMASSVSYTPMLVGRLLAGVGAGAAASVNAAYLADIAPDAWRGIFGSLTQVMLNVGLLLCAVMNIFFATIDSWRVVLIVSVIPALLQLMCVPWIATSPRDVASWYPLAPLEPDAPPEALEADPLVHLLRRLWGDDVDDTVLVSAIARLRPMPVPPTKEKECENFGTGTEGSISGRTLIGQSSSVGRVRSESQHTSRANKRMSTVSTASARSRRRRASVKRPVAKPATIWEFLTTKRYRYSLGILSLAHFSLQASGITLYFSYSHSILTLLFSPDTAKLVFALSIAYHVVLILICGRLLDTHGRRPLFLAAYTVMGISAFLLNTASILRIHWLALFAFFGAVTGFALGMGNVPYVLISELVDGRAVASAAAVSLTVNWTTQGLYLVAFLPLLALIKSWVFVVIGAITLAAGWVAWRWVPETWGRSGAQVLEEMNCKPRKEWKGICDDEEGETNGSKEKSGDANFEGQANVPRDVVQARLAEQSGRMQEEEELEDLENDPTSYGTDFPVQPMSTFDPYLMPPVPALPPAQYALEQHANASGLHMHPQRLSAPPTHQLYSLSALARTGSTNQLSMTETASIETSHDLDDDSASHEDDEATSMPGSSLTSRAVTPVAYSAVLCAGAAGPPMPALPAAFARGPRAGAPNAPHNHNDGVPRNHRATVIYESHVATALQGLAHPVNQLPAGPRRVGAHERTRTM
ncbi:major facilitator superfamily domain-containing protein [Catenaria anguillulae PL171]|uniref:Major facilitator superfamily domain-containing protein n=1 Tax=Catenaria anguillulae PL171 TaxID=765915 RepID=A0A1Y2I1J6_9FUNG|nr:major facilitator superfamily domain-containing protein [Catenaria anguillulae PL171]